MSATSTILLNNGTSIPQVGFGVFQIPAGQTQRLVEEALAAGYRHIDTAAAYNNESGVGAAIRASGIPRDEVFVTTKLRNGDQGYDSALRAYEDSCRRLGLEAVDLYLVHWPFPSADRYVDSWRGLQRLAAQGRVRAIGVSNFLPEHLDRLRHETEVVPAVNQIELHPSFQQTDIVDACRAVGIAVEAYSPLGQGEDLNHPVLKTIAASHGASSAQIVLRWHLQRGHIVIPKSATPERIRANIGLDGFVLSEDELRQIRALESGHRIGGDPRTFSLSQIRPIQNS